MGTKREDEVRVRKDPKGKAKHTLVHRDRTKYTRKRKHKEQSNEREHDS